MEFGILSKKKKEWKYQSSKQIKYSIEFHFEFYVIVSSFLLISYEKILNFKIDHDHDTLYSLVYLL